MCALVWISESNLWDCSFLLLYTRTQTQLNRLGGKLLHHRTITRTHYKAILTYRKQKRFPLAIQAGAWRLERDLQDMGCILYSSCREVNVWGHLWFPCYHPLLTTQHLKVAVQTETLQMWGNCRLSLKSSKLWSLSKENRDVWEGTCSLNKPWRHRSFLKNLLIFITSDDFMVPHHQDLLEGMVSPLRNHRVMWSSHSQEWVRNCTSMAGSGICISIRASGEYSAVRASILLVPSQMCNTCSSY